MACKLQKGFIFHTSLTAIEPKKIKIEEFFRLSSYRNPAGNSFFEIKYFVIDKTNFLSLILNGI